MKNKLQQINNYDGGFYDIKIFNNEHKQILNMEMGIDIIDNEKIEIHGDYAHCEYDINNIDIINDYDTSDVCVENFEKFETNDNTLILRLNEFDDDEFITIIING